MPTKICKHCSSIIDTNAKICPFCRRKQNLGVFTILLIIFAPIFGVFLTIGIVATIIGIFISVPDDKSEITTTISKSDMKETITKPTDSRLEELLFNPGDMITSDKMEVTINTIEFTQDVLPDVIDTFYTHYEADDGEVYIHIDADVKNLSKKDLDCDEILTATANYNDGYTYKGQAIVEDKITGFTYASITSIEPLKTQGMRFIINCPEEVEISEYPLFLTIKLQGTNDIYTYDIRQ